MFATEKVALYTIEESRGKGVPERLLGKTPIGVLVRDDYGAYKKLPLLQQSCWTHLLRVSREAALQPTASVAAQTLHLELKEFFATLSAVVASPFVLPDREREYGTSMKRLQDIMGRTYADKDAKVVQKRISNQNKNLLTALLHPNVPLTNNHAERHIRSMVVTRKISGGSRSVEGAKTHAVLMSVLQTIALQGKSFHKEIRKLLTTPTHRYSMVVGGR